MSYLAWTLISSGKYADACIVKSDPYEAGWLYSARGEPEEDSMDVHGYVKLLQETIQKMQEAGYGDDDAAH